MHSCHVHIMLYSLSGGSLEPAVTSLETLQACCNFLWNNSGMSIIMLFFLSILLVLCLHFAVKLALVTLLCLFFTS